MIFHDAATFTAFAFTMLITASFSPAPPPYADFCYAAALFLRLRAVPMLLSLRAITPPPLLSVAASMLLRYAVMRCHT